MVTESFAYVPKMIEKRFYGQKSGYKNAAQLTGTTNKIMMEMLVDNLLGEIVDTAETAFETSKKLYTLARLDEDAFREAALTSTLYTEAIGKGAAISAKLMEATVRNHGITGFVDKSGRHWSLYSYCNMATRTTARQAEVAGILSKDDEQDLYRILPHTSACGLCAPLQGRVYSKSGTSPYYPPLAIAFGKIDPNGGDDLINTYLNIHPNCLCTLVPYTEAGKTDEQIQKIRDFSNPEKNPVDKDPRSKKQIEAYRRKERNRREKLAEYRAKMAGKIPKPSRLPKPLNIPKPQAQIPAPVKQEPPKFVSQYIAATTIAEANKYAERFTDKSRFGALGVDYKGVSVDVANIANKTIGDFYDEYNVEKFGGIIAPAGNTKAGKLVEGATAAYSPVRNSFYLNRKSLKDLKTAQKAIAEEQNAVIRYLKNPELYDLDKARPAVRNVLLNSRKSGRGTVPETLEDVINHELGHSLEKGIRQLPNYRELQERMSKYADTISGYATQDFGEYVAESFCSYKKGESVIDPEMIKAFEALKRK